MTPRENLPAGVTILLIDDDVELVRLLTQIFSRESIAVRSATTGTAGLESLNPAPSLVLLDLMLPDMHGKEVFRRLRERMPALPVIMLTAKGDPVDRVIGLELGADDYVPKPFDPRELIARVRTVLRRTQLAQQPTAAPDTTSSLLKFGKLVLDTSARTLTSDTGAVPLTNIEFRLLLELVRHPGTALSRESLTRAAQVGNYRPLDRAVDVQIARLRRKLRQADDRAQWIAPHAARAMCDAASNDRAARVKHEIQDEAVAAAYVRPDFYRADRVDSQCRGDDRRDVR